MYIRKMLRVIGFVLALIMFVQTNMSAIYAAQGGNIGKNQAVQTNVKKEIPKLKDLEAKKPEKIPPGIAKDQDKFEKWKDKKEIIENRTIDSKTYDNGDGTNTLIQFFRPIHVKDAQGKFVNIDNSLVAETSKEGKANYKNKLGLYDVLFSNTNSAPNLQVKNDKISIELIPNEANTKNITVEDNKLMYKGNKPGIDFLYTVLDSGVKEDIVLNHYVEIDSFTYDLKVTGGTNLVEENGNILIVDKKTGLTNMTISAPYMSDADGKQSKDLSLSIDRKGFGSKYSKAEGRQGLACRPCKSVSGEDRSECKLAYISGTENR